MAKKDIPHTTHKIKKCSICRCNYHDDLIDNDYHETPIKCGNSCCTGKPKCYVCQECECSDH